MGRTNSDNRIVRLYADGDPESGMSRWSPITYDAVIEGEPQSRLHKFFVANRGGVGEMRVGVWEATAYSEKIDNYAADEIMFVLEGSVTILSDDGEEDTLRRGDCFFMPRGFSGIWKQTETMKKLHMTVDDPDGGQY